MSVEPTTRIKRPATGVICGGLVSPEALTLRLTHIEVLEYEHAKRIGDEWTEAGRQMRVRREAAGLSLRKLAAMLEVSPPFLSDMERGFRHYTIRYAAPALKIFGANIPGQPRPDERKGETTE